MSSKDGLGDRMKKYERMETDRRFMPLSPIYARIDGRSFSKFTAGMCRPYDIRMSLIMEQVTKYLVQETGACAGYTQSDEISLCWHQPNYDSEVFFAGKIQKMVSTLSALATAKFVERALSIFPERCEKRLPTFDARVFQLPNTVELANAFLWRVQDAIKNSIQMTAQHYFTHSELQGLDQRKQLELLETRNVVWGDFPQFFKEGTFVKREVYMKEDAYRTRVVALTGAMPFKDHPSKEEFLTLKTIGSIKNV